MARRKRGGRRGMRVGKWVNLGFKIAGALVAGSPGIKAGVDHMSDPQNIPAALAYNYTGFDINTGGFNAAQTGVGVGSLLAGVIIAKVGGFLGRRF